MTIMLNTKLAFKSILRRKQRNLAVILGVALGVSLIAGIQVSIDSSAEGWKYYFTLSDGKIDERITPLLSPTLNETVTRTILQVLDPLNDVDATAPRLTVYSSVQTDLGTLELGVSLIGLYPNETGFGDYIDQQGRLVNLNTLNTSQIIVGSGLADSLEIKIGDTIDISTTFNQSIIQHSFTVVNILKEDYNSRNVEHLGNFLVTSITNLWSILNTTGVYSEININFKDTIITKDQLTLAGEHVKDAILSVYPTAESFLSFNEIRKDTLDLVDTLLISIRLVEWVFGSLIIFAALLVILNIQAMSMEEREQNTAIMRAIGASKGQITRFFLSESLFLGIIGSFLGLAGGIGYGRFLVLAFGYSFGFDASSIPTVVTNVAWTTAISSGIIISLITSLFPAIKASNIDVVKVLRGIKTKTLKQESNRLYWIGVILTIIGILWIFTFDPNPILDGKEAFYTLGHSEKLYLPIAFLLVGPGLILAKKYSYVIGMDFVALGLYAWSLFNIFVIFDWIQEGSGGTMYIIYILFSLVLGSVTFIGSNLHTIASFMEFLTAKLKVFGKNTQGIIMVSLRHMASVNVRTTLTFTLFASILTLNMFFATYSYSVKNSLDRTIALKNADSDLVVYSGTPIPDTIQFASTLENQFTTITHVSAYTKAPGIVLTNNSLTPDSILPVSYISVAKESMYQGNTWVNPIDIISKAEKYKPQNNEEDLVSNEINEYDNKVWQDFLNGVPYNDTSPYPIIITSPLVQFDSNGQFKLIGRPGSLLYLPLRNGTLQPFVVGGWVGDNPLSSLIVQASGITFGFAIFIPKAYQKLVWGIENYDDKQNMFLVKTTYSFTDKDKLNSLGRDIEKYVNKKDGAFRTAHGFYGVTSILIYDIFEAQLDSQYRFFQYIQLFTSLGFIVGVLGLLVVSIRSVSERKREIGMLRAIGLSQQAVLGTVILELILIALIGLIIGLINGSLMGYALVDINSGGQDKFLVPWDLTFLYTGLTLLAALVSAIIPGYTASKIPPSQALRYIG